MALALRLRDHALHDLVGKRAPELDLHAILLLEGLGERLGFRGRERRIKDDGALLLRPLDETRLAIRPPIAQDLVVLPRGLGMDILEDRVRGTKPRAFWTNFQRLEKEYTGRF